jgi:uncharacterized membrane protein
MNNTILNGTYDTTLLFNNNAIEDPLTWWNNFNNLLSGFPVITMLGFLGFVLFLAIKRTTETDTEALVWSGTITSVISVLLWLTSFAGLKLISFGQVSIFLIITGVAIFLHYISTRF